MSKLGQASTATWIIAFMVIVFASFLLLVGISVNLKSYDPARLEVDIQAYDADFVLQKNFEHFLEKKVNFNGNEILMLDFIEQSELREGDASDLFSREAFVYFSKILPRDIPPSWENVIPWSLSVYGKGEDFGTGRGYFHAGSFECEPYNERSVTLVHFGKSKKVVLCVFKFYMLGLEEKKNE